MKLVTAKQMGDLDHAAIVGHDIPSLKLMERAGGAVADAICKRFSSRKGPIAIIAGKGNNGGDGLVAARHLVSNGFDVIVLLLATPSELSPDARANWELLAPLTTHIFTTTSIPELNSRETMLAQAACIVDAVLGTGLSKEVHGLALAAIDMINVLNIPVVAVDIPSGLSADRGIPLGRAVRANTTVTFGLPKLGLLVGEGLDYSGDIEVADIGLPAAEMEKIESPFELIEPGLFKDRFHKRKPNSHKGDFGHIIVFAGSRGHMGAGYLACLAGLRAGCGLATYCLPNKAFAQFDARYPEIMCDPIPDCDTAHFHPDGIEAALRAAEGKNAAAIGPAIGTKDETREFVNAFVKRVPLPLVIDADGLNVLDLDALRGRKSDTILTPHPGEMARLLKDSTAEVQKNRIAAASKLSRQTGAIVVLKGRGTIVARPSDRIAINATGNPGMATAGMGDALTGMIASFIAQGMNAFEACAAGVYIHGAAGDLAAAELGERALITKDVIKKIGGALKAIEGH